MIEFEGIPEIGTVVILDDQEFELVSIVPHQKADGSMTDLLLWASLCATCGQSYETKTTVRTSGISRRCSIHSKPGKPVKGKRGRKVKIQVILP